jgi:predicted RNA methylase
MKYQNIREEELKNRIAQNYFWQYDCVRIIGNVDFSVCTLHSRDKARLVPAEEYESLLWAEAKKGAADIYKSIVQLVLTIGKARTFDKYLPPAFLGAFDSEKIAFIPYNEIHEIFYLNDFNWNVAPSNHETKEFKLIHDKVKTIIDNKTLLFNYVKDEKELKKFIKHNFVVSKSGITKTKIDKNNFMVIYNKWLQTVKPAISVNWEIAKKSGIIDGDFYLADLLSHENHTLKQKIYVLLRHDHYELDRNIDEAGMFISKRTEFADKQVAHTQFWNRYERPPKEEYWNYIVERRDLLVPQDIRERKGSFFTPRIWVELSQKYIADVLGEDWQDEYYIWDCCAGTGNLLVGLTNKYHIWASTLDKADVDVMKDRIANGANLLESHVFQFDFLNDDFTKLPQGLQDIINDEKKRKKLVVYMNPPYAEHGNRRTFAGKGEHKSKVATINKVYGFFQNIVGTATRELYAQFFLRVYKEIPNAKLASFSTLKYINAQNFLKFRNYFQAKFLKGFICRANTFDNVIGNFPIGFLIWNFEKKEEITAIKIDVICNNVNLKHCWQEGEKRFYAINEKIFISDWLRKFYDKQSAKIGYLILPGVDMQQQNGVYITSQPTKSDILQHKTASITEKNLMEMSIYFAVRKCIAPNWINNRDQFLYPNDGWKTDEEFQNDCLAYTLFNNNIQSKHGVNDWIPFIEYAVGAQDTFRSHFMTDFISGKIEPMVQEADLFYQAGDMIHGGGGGSACKKESALIFSETAKDVFNAGGDLWRYYHKQPNINVNASLYDIREHFQGRNEKGTMNNKSADETYNELNNNLRIALKILAEKIEPKIYEYGFLKK